MLQWKDTVLKAIKGGFYILMSLVLKWLFATYSIWLSAESMGSMWASIIDTSSEIKWLIVYWDNSSHVLHCYTAELVIAVLGL